ncbi:large subunit ribosomal protein L11 [Streptoalloteichus tenebrarius]|uniref:Large ribosomal subunit protein uL11 n=1 Tax=Streptoalloteichus tenebrarius (strain ATCC 17920 / DSM 40477 / JCM 4838 / CBS 697.72 / NBRC 16177 / NCIMB 11028 / NRRL B-12390 / A12253. 1 / ISP 5477) TaxID=1933 RepID=A0ABT1HQZ0_STRSD|nr:50S ribosomal protein L11 [Streptoalloteichus tenebrarius]MCP2257940.1 large subunit ribosomal protein L11 [Streptoalloteichus tenebrarius]BFF01603.1 50S ribosomal protein L11 [Streptoalloteichus tenebrarius]
MPPKRKVFQTTVNLEAGNASMAELGKTLGPTGVNVIGVKREYDEATAAQRGDVVPVVITVHEDRSVVLRYKTPPTSFLIRKALGGKGSSRPGHESAGVLTREQLRAVASRKLPDLNTDDVDTAMRIVAGTARSMGVTIADD